MLLVISFWNRNNLSPSIKILPETLLEPKQTETRKQSFMRTVSGVDYTIEPVYEYEIQGLVVSFRLHDATSGIHFKWNDHLNFADYCIVWGNNALAVLENNYDIWNQEFTCYVQTRSNEAWDKFNLYQLSNNHLITEEEYLKKKMSQVSIGDQIRIKGWLASYASNGNRPRKTSIVRTDTGNGACETIYVNDFEITRSYTSIWKIIMYFSLVAVILELLWFVFSPYKPNH